MWSFSEIAPIPINLFSNIKLTDYSEFQVLIGTKYFSIEETMIQYKISVSTIKNRCYDSKSYRDWIYVYKGFHHFRKNQWEDKNFLRTGSQGKIWVHLENKERWIDAHLLDNLSKDGWILGRSVKNKL
jgi:hypothetical protein